MSKTHTPPRLKNVLSVCWLEHQMTTHQHGPPLKQSPLR